MTERSTAALLDQRTKELAEASKEVETVRAKLLDVQTEMERVRDGAEKKQESLDEADKDKRELESQIFCLRQNLANLEEAQSQAVREREMHRRREEEMSERIRKMEQVLEEEVEQFESLLRAKDEEVSSLSQTFLLLFLCWYVRLHKRNLVFTGDAGEGEVGGGEAGKGQRVV